MRPPMIWDASRCFSAPCRSEILAFLQAAERVGVQMWACKRGLACTWRVQKVDISPSTARTDLIFGAASIAWIQAIDAAPKMRSVRAVEGEISTFCTRQVHASPRLHAHICTPTRSAACRNAKISDLHGAEKHRDASHIMGGRMAARPPRYMNFCCRVQLLNF